MSFISQNLSAWASSLLKALVSAAVFAIPLWLNQHQAFGDMTVSGIILWALHYIDAKFAR